MAGHEPLFSPGSCQRAIAGCAQLSLVRTKFYVASIAPRAAHMASHASQVHRTRRRCACLLPTGCPNQRSHTLPPQAADAAAATASMAAAAKLHALWSCGCSAEELLPGEVAVQGSQMLLLLQVLCGQQSGSIAVRFGDGYEELAVAPQQQSFLSASDQRRLASTFHNTGMPCPRSCTPHTAGTISHARILKGHIKLPNIYSIAATRFRRTWETCKTQRDALSPGSCTTGHGGSERAVNWSTEGSISSLDMPLR
jgi:hypothetical protein